MSVPGSVSAAHFGNFSQKLEPVTDLQLPEQNIRIEKIPVFGRLDPGADFGLGPDEPLLGQHLGGFAQHAPADAVFPAEGFLVGQGVARFRITAHDHQADFFNDILVELFVHGAGLHRLFMTSSVTESNCFWLDSSAVALIFI